MTIKLQDYLPKKWLSFINTDLPLNYWDNINKKLAEESAKYEIFPPLDTIFKAFAFSSPKDIKVVILGQDPYHRKGQANGLAFSVNKGVKIPPSLRNIYKELSTDLGLMPPSHGDLNSWAKNGVLLLNTILTVRNNSAGSHKNIGWEKFTNTIICKLSESLYPTVFILWGNYAKSKKQYIARKNNYILESAHPSPFSAKNFFGCAHFSKANKFLEQNNRTPVNWQLYD